MSLTPSQNEARLTVGRWSGVYHVPRGFPVPQAVQHRAEGLVAGQLAPLCSSYLENYLSAADPEVWRIRNLTLNVSLDAGFSDPLGIVRDWGRTLASEVLSILDSGECDSVVRFPNSAAFLAQFLSDLAAGHAWGKWYYEEFADLRQLSERQAICAIFLRGDLDAAELLLQLAITGRLESVLQSIRDIDARMILDLCFEGGRTALHEDALQKWTCIVLQLWNIASLRVASRQENRFRDALRLLARVLSRYPAGSSDMQLRTVIDGLLELRRVLSEIRSPAVFDSLIKNLTNNDLASSIELATRAGACDPSGALAFLAERMQGDAAWGIQAAGVILGESHQERFLTFKTISEGESFLSAFGGVFLLGPSLDELQLEELTSVAALPSKSPEKNAALLRHLAAITCLGTSRVLDTADDPALRLFSGFEGSSFRQAFENADFSELNLGGARSVLLQNLLGRVESHIPILYAELVSSPIDTLTFILRDLTHDEWLDVTPLSPSGLEARAVVESSLRRVSDLCRLNCPDLFLSDSLFSLMHQSATKGDLSRFAQPHRIDDSTKEQLMRLLGLSRSQLAFRLSSTQQQLPFFSLAGNGAGFALDASLDSTFTLLSRAALRRLARKLFGFESSSAEHLYQNFLSGVSEIRCVDQHLEVRLPSSPLSVVLHMAGLQKQKYAPSWLKGTEVWLLPPQE